MARIKIEDLPVLEDLSAKKKKGIFGGRLVMGTSRSQLGFETETATSTAAHDLEVYESAAGDVGSEPYDALFDIFVYDVDSSPG